MTNNNQTLCVYCGVSEADTKDHVPPKCLFSPPRPSNLITVPCCSKCNSRFSMDDEYFRTAMAFRWDVGRNPSISPILSSALRAVSRDQAQRFRELFTRTLEDAPIITRSGIYLEEGAKFQVDMKRIYAVVERIIRGLHYNKMGIALPLSQRVMVLDDETAQQFSPHERKEILRNFLPSIQGVPEVFGAETFIFFKGPSRSALESTWFLVFFSCVIFFAATTSVEAVGSVEA